MLEDWRKIAAYLKRLVSTSDYGIAFQTGFWRAMISLKKVVVVFHLFWTVIFVKC
jgi:hypothetical protein